MAEQGPEPKMPPIGDTVPDGERPAEPTLAPGIERRDEFVVEGALVTDVCGTIGTSVLSTPGMIAMMERCSSVLAYGHLPQGRATVGFEVCVKHARSASALTSAAPSTPTNSAKPSTAGATPGANPRRVMPHTRYGVYEASLG